MSSAPLSACSRCFSRHPFEDLSRDHQLCKECRGAFPVVKCIYCRSEFQQDSKGNTCKCCEQNIKTFGRPSACEYCSINAAFIGSKCNRCTKSEMKYGPPVSCEHCKQKSAFDKPENRKKLGGKILCWLCTQGYKRTLARAKNGESENISYVKVSQTHKSSKHKESKSRHHHKRHRSDSASLSTQDANNTSNGPASKISRNNSGSTQPGKVEFDPHSSEHMIAMTQLKEQIVSLKKQISTKDVQLLNKDKMITELKAQHFTNEIELRKRITINEREHGDKIEFMNKRVASLLKEVATLSKNVKRTKTQPTAPILDNGNSNSGSGTEESSSGVGDNTTN